MGENDPGYFYSYRHEYLNIFFDLLSGSVAGIAITIFGHPFDTIKVRMQSFEKKASMVNIIKSISKNETFLGFYKGLGFPISTMPIVNSVVFATNEFTRRFFNLHSEDEMTLSEGFLCGGVAGFVNCIVITPVELVKCRLQVQKDAIKNSYYTGIRDCLIKTWKKDGIKGLYKGNFASIAREIPAYGGQFGGYLLGKNIVAKFRNKKINQLNMIEMMFCGSIGGYFCWQFSYPQDVIKTILQTDKTNKYKPIKFLYDGGFINCFLDIKRNNGWLGFWRGYLPCTIRALYANACLFGAYEKCKSIFEKYKIPKDKIV